MRALAFLAAGPVCLVAAGFITAGDIVKGKLSRTVPKAVAAKLLKAADDDIQHFEAARLKEDQGRSDAVEAALKMHSGAFAAALAKQKDHAAYRMELDALLKRAKEAKADRAAGAAASKALAALNERHGPMLRKAHADAKIHDDVLQGMVAKHFGAKMTIQAKSHGTFSVKRATASSTAPAPSAFRLTLPYDQRATHREGSLLNFVYADATPESGLTSAYTSNLYAGGAAGRATVGEYVSVPAGYKILRVSAKIQVDYSLFTGGLGAGYADADLLLELTGADAKTQRAVHNLGSVLSVVFWTTSVDGSEEVIVSKDFLIADKGDYLVRAGSRASGWVGGLTYAKGSADTTVLQISVEARK